MLHSQVGVCQYALEYFGMQNLCTVKWDSNPATGRVFVNLMAAALTHQYKVEPLHDGNDLPGSYPRDL